MFLKFYLILLFTFLYFHGHSQDTEEFGRLTESDKSFITYEKDPDAPAVVLYEKGDYFYITRKDRLYLVKRYHAKIKILKESGFQYGDISIPLLISSEAHEDVADIKAITHYDGMRSELSQEHIYPSNKQAGVLEVKFTFPRIRVGSILEYKYTLLSPFFSNLEGWEFQSTIPKIYSEFNASIPYKLKYNRTLVGDLELCQNESSYEDCYLKMGNTHVLLCEDMRYAMENIPAFMDNEEYMLGASNYISRLDFELSKIDKTYGAHKYTTNWKDVDRQFKKNKDVGKQLHYKGFFGRQVPDHLLEGKDELTKARNIYNFIRDYYTWNGGFGIYGESRVKEAFDEKKGNVVEVNMSLINLLNSAGLKADLVMMSTRNLGLPKKVYPTMSDFNYIIAKVQVAGREYLLDATSKNHPFGILPFRALNHYGRVMDFKEDSYWYDINPYPDNNFHVRALMEVDPDSQTATGIMETTRTGYDAVELYEIKDELSEEEYLNVLTSMIVRGAEVTGYEEKKNRDDEAKVQERIQIEMKSPITGNRIYLNPFLIRFFDNNPFQAEERKYPIDFGFPEDYKYQVNIKVPQGYEVLEVPQNNIIKLGENLALLKHYSAHNEQQVTLTFELGITKSYFEPADYGVLKKLFSEAVAAQNNSMVIFQKK